VRYFGVLHNPQQGWQLLSSVFEQIKPWLHAGHKLEVRITPERRTGPQNDKVHPVVREIAKAAGRPLDEASLKTLRYLLLEKWRYDTGRRPMFERSLDGMRMVNVDGGTSDLDKPDCSEFIEFLEAWKAEHMEQTA
jgi:hypothetical protein